MFKFRHIFAIFLIVILKNRDVFANEYLFVSEQKNIYYIEIAEEFTWFDALARCASMNMSLATIDTKIKSDDITALLKKTFEQQVFLWFGGCVNGVNPRQFVWIATGKKFVFTNWGPSQPDFNNSKEYCAHIGSTTMDAWNDNSCTAQLGFICDYNQQVHKCEESDRQKQSDAHMVVRDIIFNLKQ